MDEEGVAVAVVAVNPVLIIAILISVLDTTVKSLATLSSSATSAFVMKKIAVLLSISNIIANTLYHWDGRSGFFPSR